MQLVLELGSFPVENCIEMDMFMRLAAIEQ